MHVERTEKKVFGHGQNMWSNEQLCGEQTLKISRANGEIKERYAHYLIFTRIVLQLWKHQDLGSILYIWWTGTKLERGKRMVFQHKY